MGWNGSRSKQTPSTEKLANATAKIKVKISGNAILIAVLSLVAICGILTAWLFHGKSVPAESPTNVAENDRNQYAEATMSFTTNKVHEQPLPLNVKRDHSELSREDLLKKVPHWAYTVEDRKRLDPGYEKRHERFLKAQAANPWKTSADRSLAALLFNGGGRIIMPKFNAQFKEVFLKSLETPIIPSEDDSDEVAEKKRQMIETKVWLKEQLDEGKDIVAILNEEYDFQQKINNMRDTLRRELFELQKQAKSVEEIDDYIAAANKMLKEAGDTRKLNFPTMALKYRLAREADENEKGGAE